MSNDKIHSVPYSIPRHIDDPWRMFRIIAEFVDGFETLRDIGPSVSVFGSARVRPDSPHYKLAVSVSQKIAEKGFAIITGAGPGMMEAANKGAQAGFSPSCGLGINLPNEVHTNPYVDEDLALRFRYFFVRKVMFVRYALAFVVLPGGFGTLDEFFESLTLIQTQKIRPFPVYLVGTEFWSGLLDWVKDTLIKEKMIAEEDLDLFTVTDDPDFIAASIEDHFKQLRSLENF